MSHKKIPLDDILGRRIGLAGRAMRDRMKEHLAATEADLTLEQFVVMVNVWHHDGMYQQEIADFMPCDKTTTTRLIDALELRQLVYREVGRRDRRRKLIHLTEDGKKLCSECHRCVLKTQSEAVRDIEPEHVRICRDVLKKISENLTE